MDDKICKYCKWRIKSDDFHPINLCSNPKIHEASEGNRWNDDSDELVYTFSESGAFHVGDNFGCVHWEEQLLQ